ncbi:peptidoglycan endopeptidase LytE [Planomicrobium soli]|uniref:Peptidoglycan endopeptidase LytE n=1 Tax=Planomicrobium soli TaxID=1176648 RepID=A0A2P8H385_9BACL|nr:C40 family peptidase [Planomicrobium soli]PSL40678.1 peptidoglycan endopeptidase LytE [Planomicrobium soli]
MKKLVFTILAAGSLVLSNSATDVEAAINSNTNSVTQAATNQSVTIGYNLDVEQVASSKATKISGTYKFKHTSNVRQDAGTKYKKVALAKKGAKATVSHKKKVGSQTWYKVKVGSKSGWVLSTLVTKSTTKKASSKVKKASNSSSNSKIVSEALALKGTPYVFGGTTTRGFDCSGFIQYAYKQAGKSISRTTLSIYSETKKVSSPQPGDLVFFANTYRPGISHAGIYIGNNQFIHAGGSKAAVVSLNDSYWGPKFHSFRSF